MFLPLSMCVCVFTITSQLERDRREGERERGCSNNCAPTMTGVFGLLDGYRKVVWKREREKEWSVCDVRSNQSHLFLPYSLSLSLSCLLSNQRYNQFLLTRSPHTILSLPSFFISSFLGTKSDRERERERESKKNTGSCERGSKERENEQRSTDECLLPEYNIT